MLELVVSRRQWVHRIVETIDFIDDRRFSRHVSVDFTIPAWPAYRQCEKVLPQGRYIIPVALLSRGRLKRFDIVDEAGAVLPVLTRPQNQALDQAMLINAKAVLANLQRQEIRITYAGPVQGKVSTPPVSEASRVVDRLSGDARLLVDTLTQELDSSFFLCVLIGGKAGERRVVKYSYEDAPRRFHGAPGTSMWRRFLRTIGWLPLPIDVPCPALSYAASYHIENAPPDDLFFESGQLVVLPEATELDSERNVDRLHLHPAERPKEGDVHLFAGLRLQAEGILYAAILVGVLASALMAGGLALRLRHASPSGDVAAALLLALPGVFGAYVFRPVEHRLVSRVAIGIRVLVGTLIAVSFGGAGLIAIRFDQGGRLGWWMVLTAVSLLCTGVIAAVLLKTWVVRLDAWPRFRMGILDAWSLARDWLKL